MRTLRTSLLALTVVTAGAAACGPKGGDDGNDASLRRDGTVTWPDGTAPRPDGGAPLPDGGSPGPDAAAPTVSWCAPACGTAADCDLGSAPYDSDNYTCSGGACVYTGCTSDAECQSLGAYRCRQPAGYAMPLCLPACTVQNDCNQGSAPYDPDNYSCTGGVCLYTGCNSDAECQSLGSYVCRASPWSSMPTCLPACATAADCNLGSAPYDADNYDCLNGGCVYTGCNSHAECQALGSYVCGGGQSPLPFR